MGEEGPLTELVIKTNNLIEGALPNYTGPIPMRPDDENHYVFSKWTPDIVPVTGDAEYRTVYDATPIRYAISWYDDVGDLLKVTQCKPQAIPQFSEDGTVPTKEGDAASTYTFQGWSSTPDGMVLNELPPATRDASYYAHFLGTLNSYSVEWRDYDGTLLDSETYVYGATPTYKGEEPYREGNEDYECFPFVGWDKEILPVTGNVAYTATYETFEDPTSLYRFSKLDDGTYCVDGLADSSFADIVKRLSIPSSIDGTPVTSIGDKAFQNCTVLSSVIIPDSIKSIGSMAFAYDSALKDVAFGGGLLDLGNNAFVDCASLTELHIPRSLQHLGVGVFFGSGITSISLPFIGESPDVAKKFSYLGLSASKLTSLTLLEGCTALGEGSAVFSGALYLPSTISEIGKDNSVNETHFAGYLADWTKISFEGPSTFNHLYLGDELLTSITKDDVFSDIPDYAFNGVTSLTSVALTNSVHAVGESAFAHCANLASVDLSNVKEVGKQAFYSCGLSSVHLGKDLETIGADAFKEVGDCDFYFDGAWEDYLDLSIDGALLSHPESTQRFYLKDEEGLSEAFGSKYTLPKDLAIPETIPSIPSHRFYGFAQLESLSVPSTVTSIGDQAFAYCSGLTEVDVPSNVLSLGVSAFAGCSKLIRASIGNASSLTGTFKDCEALKEVTLNGLEQYDEDAFTSLPSLQQITITGSESYSSEDGILYNGDKTVLIRCPKGVTGSVTIPSSVTEIADEAFLDCRTLRGVSFPAGLKRIGKRAFQGCRWLREVLLPAGIETVDENAFNGVGLTKLVTPFVGITKDNPGQLNSWFGEGGAVSIEVMEGCTEIAVGAFNVTDVREITLPKSLTRIPRALLSLNNELQNLKTPFLGLTPEDGDTAFLARLFGGLSAEESSRIPTSLKTVEVFGDGPLGKRAFYNASSLTEIIIGDGVETFGEECFYKCSALTKLTVPFIGSTLGENAFFGYLLGAPNYGVTKSYVPATLKEVIIGGLMEEIPAHCFSYVHYVEKISIGPNVTEIKGQAFQYASGIQAMEIPDNVTAIGDAAFSQCDSLESLDTGDGIQDLGSKTLYGCYALKTLRIGASITHIAADPFGSTTSVETILYDAVNATFPSSQMHCPFYRVSSVKSFVIGDNVEKIPDNFAYDCTGLTTVTFGANLEQIGHHAFAGCTLLTRIHYNNDYQAWENVIEGNYWHQNVPASYATCVEKDGISTVKFKV